MQDSPGKTVYTTRYCRTHEVQLLMGVYINLLCHKAYLCIHNDVICTLYLERHKHVSHTVSKEGSTVNFNQDDFPERGEHITLILLAIYPGTTHVPIH